MKSAGCTTTHDGYVLPSSHVVLWSPAILQYGTGTPARGVGSDLLSKRDGFCKETWHTIVHSPANVTKPKVRHQQMLCTIWHKQKGKRKNR